MESNKIFIVQDLINLVEQNTKLKKDNIQLKEDNKILKDIIKNSGEIGSFVESLKNLIKVYI